MDTISTTLTEAEAKQIAEKDDFHIAPFRTDGVTHGTLTWIWVVEVGGSLYVRAYNGVRSSWYQSAVQQKAGRIKAAGMEKKVRFETVSGIINDQIDQAYKDKYMGSPYLNAMISDRAREATVRIESFD